MYVEVTKYQVNELKANTMKSSLSKAAPKTGSLRTTVPKSVVETLKLEAGHDLDWSIEVIDGKMVAIVSKAK